VCIFDNKENKIILSGLKILAKCDPEAISNKLFMVTKTELEILEKDLIGVKLENVEDLSKIVPDEVCY